MSDPGLGGPTRRPTTPDLRPATGSEQVHAREKEGTFDLAVLFRVRTMDGVLADVRTERFADRALGGLGRIGCADHFAPVAHRVLAFESHGHDRAAAHELDQLLEEAAAAVHRVEALGLRSRQPNLTQAEHAEVLAQDALDDRSGRTLRHGVGFDDAEGSLESHWVRAPISDYNRLFKVVPMSAGEGATFTPALSSALILSPAVPLPPEMMAPAWPMRLPGGAVVPAMKAATGFFMCFLM